jgi:hypothetical protein
MADLSEDRPQVLIKDESSGVMTLTSYPSSHFFFHSYLRESTGLASAALMD